MSDPTGPGVLRGRWCIVGGAGFIGSHFVDRLLAERVDGVTVFDNFSSGRRWHLEAHADDRRLRVVEADVRDLDDLVKAMAGADTVIHLASNPDIARAATDPAVDFDQGTLLTHHVVEAARRSSVPRMLYASGSGVYGDLGEIEAGEDHGPLIPVSTYGASKLAGEALIASYCFMFDLSACVFRFGNVVGPHQTHGVGYDFIRRLLEDPAELTILGDGTQSKSYVHVSDIVDAVLLAGTPRAASVQGVQRGHGRLHHRHRDRRARPRDPGPRRHGAPFHRRRSRLEGRRAGGAYQHRSHPRLGMVQRHVVAPGTRGVDAVDGGRRQVGPAHVSGTQPVRRRAVFLDRDGVLNEAVVREGKPFPPRSPDEVVVVPGVAQACRALRDVGLVLVVVTNQPDVARGAQSASGVAAINSLLRRHVTVDALYVCHHDNVDDCRCRKPRTGMLTTAALDLDLDLNQSFMVGDRWSDIAAGQGAGCRTVYIDYRYQEQGALEPDHVVSNPVEALEWVLMTVQSEEGGNARSTSLRHKDLC